VNWLAAMTIGLGDINLAANNWFYPCFLSGHIKVNYAIHGAMIGDSKAIHTQLFSPGNKLRDVAHAIEHAIFGVDVQVGKLPWH
jgi:hypothetical protein